MYNIETPNNSYCIIPTQFVVEDLTNFAILVVDSFSLSEKYRRRQIQKQKPIKLRSQGFLLIKTFKRVNCRIMILQNKKIQGYITYQPGILVDETM